MKWLTLESKMLSAVAYEGSKQLLYLRFRNTGDVYRYFHFPAAEYQAFLGAESKGRFFRSQIRDHHGRHQRQQSLSQAFPGAPWNIMPAEFARQLVEIRPHLVLTPPQD